jgi:hypothetical protein
VLSASAVSHPLLEPGDARLRHDVQLLADSGVILTPATTWPLSWPDIAAAVQSADAESGGPALERVSAAARRTMTLGAVACSVIVAGAERPNSLRSFAATPREEGEAALGCSWLGERVTANLRITAAVNPADDQSLRVDGTYAGIALSNWILLAGWVERWWGPGWDGSLILSSNARPMPGIVLDRKNSKAFRTRWLRWAGPWRATISLSQAERSDVAVPDTRLFAARVTFRPKSWLEVGLSRTAQWCGTDRPCELGTLGDLLIGRDNRNATLPAEREPGNQMAGYDFRLRSPWRALPLALYAQAIGEDEAGGLPSKFLGLAGMEGWGDSRWGSFRVYAEFADTTCNFTRRQPEFDCAYRNGLYPQGYTFRGRTLGHSLDGDGRMHSIGALLARPGGSSWTVRARRVELNRGGVRPEPGHTTSHAGDRLKDLELQYNRGFARGDLGVGLGFEDIDSAQAAAELRGFVQWRQGF